MRLPRRERPPVTVAAGEKVLAWIESEQGAIGGTRDALYLPDDDAHHRVPWHEVETADWDRETGVLTVREVGSFGQVRPVHRFVLAEPGLLLQLLRERVMASIVITRHVPVRGKAGVKVIGRRPTTGERAVAWFVEYDAGLDPADPFVEMAVESALVATRAEVGE